VKLVKLVSMREALESRAYFGRLLNGDTWRAWRVLLIAIAGEELTASERAIFRTLTNREREPVEQVEEFWGVIGRRGGKTRAMAVLGAFVAYGISKISGDRYAGEWPREAFARYSMDYQPCSKTKSEMYAALLPLINSGRANLLDDKTLIGQLINLERRVGWGGRDSIDHGPGAHDDRINAAAGALIGASEAASLGQAGFFDFITSDLRKRAEAAELDCARTR
jgi:hypothetical protein